MIFMNMKKKLLKWIGSLTLLVSIPLIFMGATYLNTVVYNPLTSIVYPTNLNFYGTLYGNAATAGTATNLIPGASISNITLNGKSSENIAVVTSYFAPEFGIYADSVGGNDANAGTFLSPLRTLAAVTNLSDRKSTRLNSSHA